MGRIARERRQRGLGQPPDQPLGLERRHHDVDLGALVDEVRQDHAERRRRCPSQRPGGLEDRNPARCRIGGSGPVGRVELALADRGATGSVGVRAEPVHAEVPFGGACRLEKPHLEHDLLRRRHAQGVDDAVRRHGPGHGHGAIGGHRVGHLAAQHHLAIAGGDANAAIAGGREDLVLQIAAVERHFEIDDGDKPLILVEHRHVRRADLLSLNVEPAIGHRQGIGDVRRPHDRRGEWPIDVDGSRFVEGDHHRMRGLGMHRRRRRCTEEYEHGAQDTDAPRSGSRPPRPYPRLRWTDFERPPVVVSTRTQHGTLPHFAGPLIMPGRHTTLPTNEIRSERRPSNRVFLPLHVAHDRYRHGVRGRRRRCFDDWRRRRRYRRHVLDDPSSPAKVLLGHPMAVGEADIGQSPQSQRQAADIGR